MNHTIPARSLMGAELRAILKGREAIRRGDYYTLDEFRTFLLGDESRQQKATGRARLRGRASRHST